MSTWIGLDSSIAAFGWAVLRSSPYAQPELVDLGVWATATDRRADRKTDDLDRRIDELADQLLSLIGRLRPEALYLEGLARGANDGWLSVSALGQVRGLVLGIGRARGLKVTSFRPRDAKRWVTGQVKSTKLDVARALDRMYSGALERIGNPKSEGSAALGATDALAIAHLGGTRRNAALRLTSGTIDHRSSALGSPDDLEI